VKRPVTVAVGGRTLHLSAASAIGLVLLDGLCWAVIGGFVGRLIG